MNHKFLMKLIAACAEGMNEKLLILEILSHSQSMYVCFVGCQTPQKQNVSKVELMSNTTANNKLTTLLATLRHKNSYANEMTLKLKSEFTG